MIVLPAAYDGRTGYSDNRSLLSWRNPVIHAERRKPWARGLSTTALKEYEPALARRITQLVELLHATRQTKNLAQIFKFFS